MNKHERKFDEFLRILSILFSVLSNILPPPTVCSIGVGGGIVVVVGSCGGTDSGNSASPPSYLVLSFSMNDCE